MVTDYDLHKYLVTEANRLGREGIIVFAWIPPQNAGSDWHGTWVTTKNVKEFTFTFSQG